MKSVNLSDLKNNPNEVSRQAQEDVVLVMNPDKPDALMVGIESANIIDMHAVRTALATALFKDGELSLSRSAKLAEMSLATFIGHVSRLGIPVINQTSQEAREDIGTLDEWLEKA